MHQNAISRLLKRRIEKLAPGEIFDYSYFDFKKGNEMPLAKALSRLSKSGTIVRLTKGRFYKPRKTSFGNLRPSEDAILKTLSEKDNRITGYPTGINVYNKLGLTTQISNMLVIATSNWRPGREMSGYRIKFVKRNFEINENDIELLQLLDAIKDIKKIPDVSIDDAFKAILAILKSLSASKLKRLAKLALKYTASARAITGAVLERYFQKVNSSILFKSLNPLSTYKIGISNELLPNQIKWNLI